MVLRETNSSIIRKMHKEKAAFWADLAGRRQRFVHIRASCSKSPVFALSALQRAAMQQSKGRKWEMHVQVWEHNWDPACPKRGRKHANIY